ncbi:hypothetical protein AOXY_G12298 [Acipenser oxyrinchus oxyrinchus]|uniref:Uncharacterized protein n=1 Tax=Acipenser oxyrinchus oxyrinchus TaxID=40147 RepID=A0AAD8DDT7_ACIOX|nr:hypothetical protein AOXY_G12298 [Acipenser oxyrinchus oxyrinchus]
MTFLSAMGELVKTLGICIAMIVGSMITSCIICYVKRKNIKMPWSKSEEEEEELDEDGAKASRKKTGSSLTESALAKYDIH